MVLISSVIIDYLKKDLISISSDFSNSSKFPSIYTSPSCNITTRSAVVRAHSISWVMMMEEVLEHVGLSDVLNKIPSQLSGGMRKRISLARTIVVDPQIMLYDEPTTGLDPITSDEISLLINNVQKKYKTSSLIITHDIECARATANRVIMLHDGEVYMEGNIEEFEKSTDVLIKSFFK